MSFLHIYIGGERNKEIFHLTPPEQLRLYELQRIQEISRSSKECSKRRAREFSLRSLLAQNHGRRLGADERDRLRKVEQQHREMERKEQEKCLTLARAQVVDKKWLANDLQVAANDLADKEVVSGKRTKRVESVFLFLFGHMDFYF